MFHFSAPDSDADTRLVFPVQAILAVVVAWLVFLVLVVLGAFTLMLVVVTAPAYVAAIVGYSGLLSSVHEYALGKAYRVPTRAALRRKRALREASLSAAAC